MTDVDWPNRFDRTPAAERKRTSKFKAPFRQTLEELADEMDRLDVTEWRFSADMPFLNDDPNTPYKDAEKHVEDPAVVVRWSKDGEQFAVACDEYSDVRDNLRATYLYIIEKRKMQARPIKTGFDEFATARLPAGDEDAVVASKPPHEVLGVDPDASREEVVAAFRERVKETHPDQGGSQTAHRRVLDAREAMLEGSDA